MGVVIEKDRKEVPTEEMFGIAKRIACELDKLPLETHQVVVGMLAQSFQHRGVVEDNRAKREQLEREDERLKHDKNLAEALRTRSEQVKQSTSVIESPQGVQA